MKMSINQTLPSETLLSSFESLDTKQVVKAREVCRKWLELINEDRQFWKVIDISVTKLETSLSVIRQFDERSSFTLQEVSVQIHDFTKDSDHLSMIKPFKSKL